MHARWRVVGFRVAAIVAVAAALAPAWPASAQEDERGVSVTERLRPELNPLGIRLDGFLAYPKVALEERYNDNIFSDEQNTNSDFITVVEPSLSIESDWSNHALNLFGKAVVGRYARSESERFDDYSVGADGRLDITRDSVLSALASYSSLHEDRGSPDDVEGNEPTEYTLLSTSALFAQRFNRLTVTLEAGSDRHDFDDVATTRGRANNDDRDRLRARAAIRAGYELVPGYGAFVRASGNRRFYDEGVDDNGFNRDSKGWELVGGLALDLGGITSGELFAGYIEQRYRDSQLDTIGGIAAGAAITWNVTPLTTVTATLSRTAEETTLPGASGFFANGARLAADHELLRNLLLNANLSLTLNDYEGIEREDLVFQAGAGAKYLLNRNFYVTFEYAYTERDSTARGIPDDFSRNIFMIRLEAQL
jgi:hypothetical protein